MKVRISEKDRDIIISYAKRFDVKEIYLFGSSLDNEREADDIDLAVRGVSPTLFFPGSASSHKDLLNVAVDEDIISQNLSDELDKYRGFRHFFVHAYGIMLEEEELQPLVENLPKVWIQFELEIEHCLKKLTP